MLWLLAFFGADISTHTSMIRDDVRLVAYRRAIFAAGMQGLNDTLSFRWGKE